jgi:hypothetical protein
MRRQSIGDASIHCVVHLPTYANQQAKLQLAQIHRSHNNDCSNRHFGQEVQHWHLYHHDAQGMSERLDQQERSASQMYAYIP